MEIMAPARDQVSFPCFLASLGRRIGEQDSRVPYRAVELLVSWAPRRSELRPFLAQVAERDGEPRIRDLAHAAP